MMFGLKTETMEAIREVLAKYPEVEKAILYGSRAIGNYRPGSDIDLTLTGENLNLTILQKMEDELDDLLLPYKIDLSLHKQIQNQELLEHIERVGKVFFDRKPATTPKTNNTNHLSEWREIAFSDFVVINPAVRLQTNEPVSFVEMKDLGDGKRYCYPSSERQNGSGSKFQEFDTLFARITPCLENGKIAQVKGLKHGMGLGSTEFLIFRGKENVSDNDFVFYLSRWNEVRAHAEINLDGTSGRQRVPKECFNDLKLILPKNLKEQTAIASVLSSLDDKIDLLHRQNATLEKMAETLFRQWFVPAGAGEPHAGGEEAKEEWEVGKLGDEFDFVMGASPPGKSYNEDGIGIPMYQGNADFGFRFPTNRVFTTDPKRFAEKFDTLISVRAPVGEQNMANERCCIGRGVAAFRFKKDNSFYTYTYYKMKSLMDEIKQFNETGTVFGSISKSDFESIDVILPDLETIESFQAKVKPIDDKILINSTQIRTLTALRDTLLPKLMSGEVRVEMN